MRSRDELRRETLRMAIAAAYNAQKQAGRELTDDEVVQVIGREIKKRREAIDAYRAAGREVAAEREQAEAGILAGYMPEQLDEAELGQLVAQAITQVAAESPRDMGKVMAAVMPLVRGRADGKQVSALVARQLAQRDLALHQH
jgi:uncharacterized protein